MTYSQVKWASQHDWYFRHCQIDNNEYEIEVRDRYTIDGVLHEKLVTFTDFTELYHWAGY